MSALIFVMGHWLWIEEMGRNPMSRCAIREGQFIGNGFTSGVPRRREYEVN